VRENRDYIAVDRCQKARRSTWLKCLESQQSVFNHFRFIEHFLQTRPTVVVYGDGTRGMVLYPQGDGDKSSIGRAPW
jgi:hypothetical protein